MPYRRKITARMSTGGYTPRQTTMTCQGARKMRTKKPLPPPKITKRDKNDPPKFAANSFLLWYRENREEIYDGSKYNNIQRAARAAWKKIGDKSKWEKMAEEDRERYQREMKEYNAKNGKSGASDQK